MRRSVLLTVMTVSVVALSACGRKDNNQVTTEQTTAINLCKLLSFHAVISSIFFKICNCNFPQAVL